MLNANKRSLLFYAKLAGCIGIISAVSTFGAAFAQAHINYTGQMSIDGKKASSYTVQFVQNGDTMQRTTAYFNAAQKLVRKEVTKFRLRPLALFSNRLDDYRTGESSSLKVEGNRYTLHRKERGDAKLEEKSTTAENAIVSTLVIERAGANIDVLDKGQEVKCMVVIPSRDMVTELRLIKMDNRVVEGVPCVAVKLEPTSFMLKMLAGEPTILTFERAAPHRLMQYEGIVGLPSDEGKQQSGVVVMKY